MILRLVEYINTTSFLLLMLWMDLSIASTPAPGTCNIEILSCTEDQCKLVTTVITFVKVTAVNWYHDNNEVNPHLSKNNRYTGSHDNSYENDKYMTILSLNIEPFLQKDYGIYKCLITTSDSTKIQCQYEVKLSQLQESSNDGNTSNTFNIKRNYIYIVIGVVAGCFIIIVVLFMAVILLTRRRNQNQRLPDTNISTSRSAAKKNRKYSNGQSNHTYASISSDVGRYEGLTARRGTKDGYDIPLGGAKEGSGGYINPGEMSRLTVPDMSDDYRLSDTSFDLDSAFSSSSNSLAKEAVADVRTDQVEQNEMNDPIYSRPRVPRLNKGGSKSPKAQGMGNPSYSGGSFHKNDQVIVVNKTINKTSVIEIRRSPSTTSNGSGTNQDSKDYQNIKKARRLT